MPKINRIEIDRSYCKGCELCSHVCPREVLEIGQERGALGYLMPAVAYVEVCTGCRQCEWACPDMAIVVVEEINE